VKKVKIDDDHVERVAASIFGGMMAGTGNALDNTKLRPFINDALSLARELIHANRDDS
jgi:hypothetical protein